VIEANRRGKREQIIDAAKQVLARDGLAACTARAVADASPLTKSAVHYYFDDIHQIVDLAMREHVTAMVTGLRHAADGVPDPAEKLWAVVDAYLATFAAQPNAAFLWFEYWIDTSRRQSADARRNPPLSGQVRRRNAPWVCHEQPFSVLRRAAGDPRISL